MARWRERDVHALVEVPQVRESCVWVHRVGVRLAHFTLREDVYLRIRNTYRKRDDELLDCSVDRGLVYPNPTECLDSRVPDLF